MHPRSMHIPDGYLSPSTCAGLYAAATPFWYIALRRVRRESDTRMVPLVSIFAAFSFVVMMFNLPLPGGTTGHAVGMGVAAIVLGPWSAILALSTALVIQAFLFGDGGISALGANCFNMAIAGSLVSYGVYRFIAQGAAIGSQRRVVAAAAAGYCGINVSALCAALEFGVQPMWFHDAAGAPLYAPYPLAIAIPAMMIGHLTVAGLAELALTAGVVAYLQRSDPGVLQMTAPGAASSTVAPLAGLPDLRRLWLGLAALLILTPLGIIAAGSAWGEWKARDFGEPTARGRIAAASQNHPPPAQVPAGLERLARLWTAPLNGYAPPFLRSAPFGYIASGAIGMGLLMGAGLVLQAVLLARFLRQAPRRFRDDYARIESPLGAVVCSGALGACEGAPAIVGPPRQAARNGAVDPCGTRRETPGDAGCPLRLGRVPRARVGHRGQHPRNPRMAAGSGVYGNDRVAPPCS